MAEATYPEAPRELPGEKKFDVNPKRLFIGILLMLLGVAVIWFYPTQPSGIDVVNGVEPVSDQHHVMAEQLIAELREVPEAERADYMSTRYPELGASIIAQLRERGQIPSGQTVDSIDYRFGSMDGVVAERGDGEPVEGWFEDQLLAVVHVTGQTEPVVVIVRCSNGLIDFPGDQLESMTRVGGNAGQNIWITVPPGGSLAQLVGYRTAIDMAERNGRALTRTQLGGRPERISYNEARALENATDRNFVFAPVYPGERLNPATLVIAPSR